MESLYAAIFTLIWAAGSIFVKLGLEYIPPLDFLVLRATLATTCFFLLWLVIRSLKIKEEKFIPTLSWKNLVFLMGTGLLLQVCYQASFFYAIEYQLSPGLLMIILGAQPIFTALIMNDKLSVLNWVGLTLGLLGLSLIVFHSVFITDLNLLGLGFGLIALIAMTLGTIGQKRFCSRIDFLTNLLLQYLISSLVFLCIDRFHVLQAIPTNLAFVVALFWMGIVVSVFATCLYYYLVNNKQLTRVTTVFYCVPALTVILDYLVYGELISTISLLGFLVTCLGLYFSFRKDKSLNQISTALVENELAEN